MFVNCASDRGKKAYAIYFLDALLQKKLLAADWDQHSSLVTSKRAIKRIKTMIGLPFSMDIIIIMCWSIWSERNSWIFNNADPSIANCKNTFKREFLLVILRAKERHKENMSVWLNNFFSFFFYFSSCIYTFYYFNIISRGKPLLFSKKTQEKRGIFIITRSTLN
jgi:hypothetical protein